MDKNSYVGKQIGSYTLVAEIAGDDFASVYQGKHIIFKERPAITLKLFRAVTLGSQQERERFIQQARLLERLKHPYSLPILDAGIHKGLPYLVTEYARNGSLRTRLERQDPHLLPLQQALTILSQVGQALQQAHQQNITHGDLKPENILFNARGDALLADFGTAFVLANVSVGQSGWVGNPAYMAPEQFRELARLSPQRIMSKESDQYALGCIAYELVTGRQPFIASDFMSLGLLHVMEDPAPPTRFNPQLPLHIEQAILKAMAKQRVHRHADVSAFITALGGADTADGRE